MVLSTAAMECDTREYELPCFAADRKTAIIDHTRLVKAISSIGMSPIDINDIDAKLRLLKQRPRGEHKIDRIECVNVSLDAQECFRVDASQRNRAEYLLASDSSRVTAFFINQEEEFYNFWREDGPEKAFRGSVFFQMHNDSLDWLMDTVKPHPSYVHALATSQGYFASFVTHDEDFRPRYMHLSFEVPHKGGLGAAGYIRIDLKTDQTVLLMSRNVRLQSHKDSFTRGGGDSGLARFKARFPNSRGMISGFDVALNVLDEFCAALYESRQYIWTKLLALERVTGKGTLYDWFSHETADLRAFSTGDLKTVHTCVTESNSNVVAAKLQIHMTDMFTTAHEQYCALRAEWLPPDSTASCRHLAMKETLIAHRSRVHCMVEDAMYTKDRMRIQLEAINTNINQAIAERAGSSASSMMVLALVGLIFLPCGLIAQILSLDYFQIAQPSVQLEGSIQSLVLIFILTILATLFCCLFYTISVRLWQRFRRRNSSCLSQSLA